MQAFNNFYTIFQAYFALMVLLASTFLVGLGFSLVYHFVKKGSPSPKYFQLGLAFFPLGFSLIGSIAAILFYEIGWSFALIATLIGLAILIPLFFFRHLDTLDRLYLMLSSILGVVIGVGYLLYGLLIALAVLALLLIFHRLSFGEKTSLFTVRLQIAADSASSALLDPIFDAHCATFHLHKAETLEETSFYVLTYVVTLRKGEAAKALMDALKEKNGNLPLSVIEGLVK